MEAQWISQYGQCPLLNLAEASLIESYLLERFTSVESKTKFQPLDF